MWFYLQLMFGLLALGVSSYHAHQMNQRAIEASALGEASLAALCYGLVGFHLILAALAISSLYFVIQHQRTLKPTKEWG
jgi:hypothetical protein